MKENTSLEILNDLIRINNDRIEGYEKAMKEIKDEDTDLNSIFMRMKGESRNYVNELTTEVRERGGEPATGATGAGKLYRTWMDLKATFTGKDRHSILSSCEYGEDAAQRAYEMALSNEDLPGELLHTLRAQKAALKTSHDEIKRYRDTTKVLH